MNSNTLKHAVAFLAIGFLSASAAHAMEQATTSDRAIEQQSSSTQSLIERALLLRKLSLGSYDTLALHLDKADLPLSCDGLKALFKNYNLVTYEQEFPFEWTDECWEILYRTFQNHTLKDQEKVLYSVELRQLSQFLEDAKSLVKSFLPADDEEVSTIRKDFKLKSLGSSLGRLFAYSSLKVGIDLKQLMHVKLPRKVLLVRTKYTWEYVSTDEARKIIDTALKVYVHGSVFRHALGFNNVAPRVSFQILFDSDEHELELFAHKESLTGKGLSRNAHKELETLCQFSPFDVGFNNIFWDGEGNATIIDTEYKGELAFSACSKLKRYPINPDL